jgi:glycosyltransferase involved in cell wall biosynthesis
VTREPSALATLGGSIALGAAWWKLARSRRAARAADSRHLALLAWALPPNSNAGVHRPLSFLRHGARLGWRFSTFQGVAPANQSQHGSELLARMPDGVRRVVVPESGRPASWRLFPKVDGGFAGAVQAASLAIETLRDDPPSMVLASGPPFSMFIAARWVAAHFGVPLVLDYRDEWTECPFDFVSAGPDDRRYEQACLASAQAVIFTTESHREHQLRVFPALARARTHVFPNGWEAEDFAEPATASAAVRPEGPLRLAHVGTLSGHASPRRFVDALDAALDAEPSWRHKLAIEFVGRRSPAEHAELMRSRHADLITTVDHVSKTDAVRRMREADALLLLASSALERYLPGKLFDYVAARRPVLVCGWPGESSAALVDQLGMGVLCRPDQPGAMLRALSALEARRHTATDPRVEPWLRRHRRDVVAQQAFSLFAQLCRR